MQDKFEMDLQKQAWAFTCDWTGGLGHHNEKFANHWLLTRSPPPQNAKNIDTAAANSQQLFPTHQTRFDLFELSYDEGDEHLVRVEHVIVDP